MSALTRTFHSQPKLVSAATDTLAQHIKSALNHQQSVTLALSGGKTPIPVFAQLGQRHDIPWSRVHVLLIDERYVPRTHPESNFHMLESTLLKAASIPVAHILAPRTKLPLEECVQDFAEHTRQFLREHPIDILFLGIGDDGHIASLFPILSDEMIGDAIAIHTTTERFAMEDRITLTLPVLETAKKAIFMFHGEGKIEAWNSMLKSTDGYHHWPAKAIIEHCDTTVLIGD